jgi:cystathionine beta-lyase/cystathionine gamma-synthase
MLELPFFANRQSRTSMSDDNQHFKTREVHAGVSPDPVTGAILTPIYQTTTYVQESVDQYLEKGYSYSRSGNPTVTALENRITALEGGAGSLCFATGMAATSCTIMALTGTGKHAILSDVVYGGTHRISTKVLNRWGLECSFVDTSDPENVKRAIRENTTLIFTESPANPTLKLTDIAAISEVAQANRIPHVVDNTFLTPYFQRPLELGADISLHSTTKFMEGHNVSVGGSITAAAKEHLEQIMFVRNCLGSNMTPMVAFYTLQGIKTMSTRLEAQSANALKIARFLETHANVDQPATVEPRGKPGIGRIAGYAFGNHDACGHAQRRTSRCRYHRWAGTFVCGPGIG